MMMNRILFIGFYMSALLLNGCGIGGIWMEPSNRPRRPDYPYDTHWIKVNTTPEIRRADSKECGAENPIGNPTDYSIFTREQYLQEHRSSEDGLLGAMLRLQDKWKTCMKSKGYEYLEVCDDVSCMYPLSKLK